MRSPLCSARIIANESGRSPASTSLDATARSEERYKIPWRKLHLVHPLPNCRQWTWQSKRKFSTLITLEKNREHQCASVVFGVCFNRQNEHLLCVIRDFCA